MNYNYFPLHEKHNLNNKIKSKLNVHNYNNNQKENWPGLEYCGTIWKKLGEFLTKII